MATIIMTVIFAALYATVGVKMAAKRGRRVAPQRDHRPGSERAAKTIQVGHQRCRHRGWAWAEDVRQQTGQKHLPRPSYPPQGRPHEVAQTRVGQHPLTIEAAVRVRDRVQAFVVCCELGQRLQTCVATEQVRRG